MQCLTSQFCSDPHTNRADIQFGIFVKQPTPAITLKSMIFIEVIVPTKGKKVSSSQISNLVFKSGEI